MRPEKESMLAELKKTADDSVFLIFTDYSNINESKNRELRGVLREVDANVRIVKNRMFSHVAKDMGLGDEMDEHLKGPTGMVFGSGDVGPVAKKLKEFIKSNNIATVKMGAMEGAFLSEKEILAIADLPSREELMAQLLGTIIAPAQQLANLFNNSLGEFASLLSSYEDKLKEEG